MPDYPSPLESDYPTTERSRMRRLHQRGSHGRADVHAILDAAPLCQVDYTIDGLPHVTPTLHWLTGTARRRAASSTGSRARRCV